MSTHNSTNTPGHTIAPGKTLAAGHALAGSTSTRSRSAPPVPPTPAVTPAHRVLVLTFLLLLGLLGALVAPLVASADPAAGSSARVKCKVVVGANSPVFAASSGNWYQARDNVAERGNAQLTDRLGVPDITTDFVQAGDVVWGYRTRCGMTTTEPGPRFR